jgi:hypothetical protein
MNNQKKHFTAEFAEFAEYAEENQGVQIRSRLAT